MQHGLVIITMGIAQTLGISSRLLCIFMLIPLALLPMWLIFVSFSSRSFRVALNDPDSNHNSKPIFLGQPRLLATQVSHTRVGSGKYNYTVPHFLVGTPVGMKGHIGGVLSLDETSIPSLLPGSTFASSWLSYIMRNIGTRTWFTVHSHHHLEKGNDSVGLQGKLHSFLQSQGENPDEWPYAYLVTMPQFLGYQRNLVCFWYLYSASRELTGMVMEVNNYWGQRKIAFSRLTGEAPMSSLCSTPDLEIISGSAPSTSVRSFRYSSPRHHTYRGTWDKDMFISPFEKVEGSIALRFSDPLAPNGNLHITITLLGSSGKARLVGRVFCPDDHAALEPLSASSRQLLTFLPYWTVVLVVTELLIIITALRIRSRGMIKFYPMPEVRPNNIPRDETSVERTLEASFREYLKHLINGAHLPLRLEYIPSKSHRLKPITFTSASWIEGAPTLTMQVLTPQFYTSIASYTDPHVAFIEESRPSSLPSDPVSRSLAISDISLLFNLLSCPSAAFAPTTPLPTPVWSRISITTLIVNWLRGTRQSCFMDVFVSAKLPQPMVNNHYSALLTHLLASRVALGSHILMDMYVALANLSAQAGLSYVLFWAWKEVLASRTGSLAAMLCHWMILGMWKLV